MEAHSWVLQSSHRHASPAAQVNLRPLDKKFQPPKFPTPSPRGPWVLAPSHSILWPCLPRCGMSTPGKRGGFPSLGPGPSPGDPHSLEPHTHSLCGQGLLTQQKGAVQGYLWPPPHCDPSPLTSSLSRVGPQILQGEKTPA